MVLILILVAAIFAAYLTVKDANKVTGESLLISEEVKKDSVHIKSIDVPLFKNDSFPPAFYGLMMLNSAKYKSGIVKRKKLSK